jgi:hypothetical protein
MKRVPGWLLTVFIGQPHRLADIAGFLSTSTTPTAGRSRERGLGHPVPRFRIRYAATAGH